MQVTAALVKELRERSGAGMMECKKALVETQGDVDAAFDHLRKSGVAKAAKKAGRVAADGAIVIAMDADTAAIVEVNSETDFVAKDGNFKDFADAVAACVLRSRPHDVAALATQTIVDDGTTVEDARQQLVAKIGENISLRRFSIIEKASDRWAHYLHGNRIGVVVEMSGGSDELAKDIAMHIAASNPLCIAEADLAADVIAKETEVQRAQAEQSGKPPEIVEKMIAGRIKKFIGEVTLLGQAYVKDPDIQVGKLLAKAGAQVHAYVRYEVGAGIEKKEENFAEEVMAQARQADIGAA